MKTKVKAKIEKAQKFIDSGKKDWQKEEDDEIYYDIEKTDAKEDFIDSLLSNFDAWYPAQDYSDAKGAYYFIKNCYDNEENVSKYSARLMKKFKKEFDK